MEQRKNLKKYYKQSGKTSYLNTEGSIANLSNVTPAAFKENDKLDVDQFGKAMDRYTFMASLAFIILFDTIYWIVCPM